MPPLPESLNPNLPECKRLTKVLSTLDSGVVCVWHGAAQQWEIWGPSKALGWAFLSAVTRPDGSPVHPDVYPLFLLAELKSREAPLNTRAVLDANAQMVEKRWHAAMDEAGEMAKYVAKAIVQEAEGALRYGAEDVFAGLASARGAS